MYRERAALYYPLSFDSSVIDSKIPDTTKDGSSIALTIFTANPPVSSRVNDERLPTSQNPSPLVPGLGIQKKNSASLQHYCRPRLELARPRNCADIRDALLSLCRTDCSGISNQRETLYKITWPSMSPP